MRAPVLTPISGYTGYFVAEYVLMRMPAGDWRLQGFGLGDTIDELSKAAPFVPLKPAP